jgi:hypothetical protein
MNLSPNDVELFYRLTFGVFAYINRKLSIVAGTKSPEDVRQSSFEDKVKIRDALWNNTDLIDSYVKENPDKLSLDELAIIESWKHRVKGKFFLVNYLKDYAVFLMEADVELALGVVPLSQPFEATVGSHLPLYLETVLLPFKGKIIYDGVIAPYNISFGKGYREGIKESYQQAKAKHGIITSLPFSLESKKQRDEDLLRFYLKNQQNRDRYWEDIWDLIGKKPSLRLLYHQEMGKIHSRTYKKRFRDIGIEMGWFAVLEGLIVGSGATKEEAQRAVKRIVPSEKRALVHIFQLGK